MVNPAGYSGTPLIKKLGIRPGFNIYLISPPDNYFDLLGKLPEEISFKERPRKAVDFIHFFVKDSEILQQRMPALKNLLKPDGMIWVSWPKKSSKVLTTVDEGLVRKAGLGIGLVDVKICAVDDIWSGLKFVFRLKDR